MRTTPQPATFRPLGQKGSQTMGSMIEPLICPSLCVYPQVSRLLLTTFIDSAKLWDEEIYAHRLGEERLALSALDLVANGWMAHDDTQVSERLINIWKTFSRVIREREERPGKMDAAWLKATKKF